MPRTGAVVVCFALAGVGLVYRMLHVTSVPVTVDVYEDGGYTIVTKPIAWTSRWDLTGVAPHTVPYRTVRKDGTVLDGLWVFGVPDGSSFQTPELPRALMYGVLGWKPCEVWPRFVSASFGNTTTHVDRKLTVEVRVDLPDAAALARGGL
jgi:hypothetical protein